MKINIETENIHVIIYTPFFQILACSIMNIDFETSSMMGGGISHIFPFAGLLTPQLSRNGLRHMQLSPPRGKQ